MARDGQTPPDGGFVNVYKPIGAGSTQVVGRVRRAVGVRRVGHCGTLDPLAWGVLPLAVGRATRLSRYVLEMPKVYQAAVLFGVETPSYDLETHPTGEPRRPPPPQAVEQLLPAFTGAIEQRPPEYSAIQVDGVRAYHSARAGRRLDLPPRQVHIRALDRVAAGRIGVRVVEGRLRFGDGAGSSDGLLAGLRIECSSGTYIRALAGDLGAALDCGAMLFGLVRTRVGPFTLSAATEMWQLDLAARDRQHVALRACRVRRLATEQGQKFGVGQAEHRRGRLEIGLRPQRSRRYRGDRLPIGDFDLDAHIQALAEPPQ